MKNVTMLTKEGFLLLSTYVDIVQQLKCWTSTYVDSMQLVVHSLLNKK